MKNYKILIIDDQIQIIHTIIDCLEEENSNYNFFHAQNGLSGIEVALKHQPDLIITDWEMPGFSGIDTIKALKKNDATKDIPVIMLTGIMTNSEHLETALSAGAIDYIRKPIDKIELTARIKSMLMLANSHKEILNLKNRELASTAMNIVKSNEFNSDLLQKLNSIIQTYGVKNKDLETELEEIAADVSYKIKSEAWVQFESYFRDIHPDFLKTLTCEFPDLTPTEIKLSSFLRLNLSTKEIADITFNSPDSIKTSRNRLRRKLKLEAGDNLVAYIMSL